MALEYLNLENTKKKKTSSLSPYPELKLQKYFEFLSPADSRLLFAIRSGTLDIKTFRKYNYADGDVLCRLCGESEETVDHIVNHCKNIPRSDLVENIYSIEKDSVDVIVARMRDFVNLSAEQEKEEEKEKEKADCADDVHPI